MLFVASALLLASGCQKYRADPLEPTEVFRVIEAQRQPAAMETTRPPLAQNTAATLTPNTVFTLQCAADWLRASGPDVQETLAEYRTALALAKINTPLPNPGLEIGPQFGFGPDLGPVNQVTPFGSIGFTIPLGKRLRRQTELNRALAEVARVHALARFRELYLELRSRYAELAISRQRLTTRREIAASAEKTLSAGRQLVQAGQANAMDVALFELELQRSLAEVLTVERELVEAEGKLSKMLGVHFERFRELPERTLPVLPDAVPSLEQLREQLILNHTELARLRSQYEASERALRLEISKQFPDLQIGPNWENEVGERKTVIGLTLGIELPLFDRNQQGIAEAKKKREEIRAKYEAEAKRALAELERAQRDLELARRNTTLMRGKILPLARTNVELARRSLQAGSIDALRLLDAERSEREILIEALTADLEECSAWVGLEQAVGCPLVAFPSEQDATCPKPPDGLNADEDKEGEETR
jgi:outer membrane protein TolC